MIRKAQARSGEQMFSPVPQIPPQFAADQVGFMERFGSIVQVVRNAEMDGHWDMARPFMSTRLYRRWQPWAAGLKRDPSSAGFDVTRQIFMSAMQSEPSHDRATIRVVESYSTSPGASAATLWTFLRCAGGRPGDASTGFASVCTNCGAPVDATAETVCKYCGAGLSALGPEWILDDISMDPGTARFAA